MQTDNQCPYQVGDKVLYMPSRKGLDLSVNDSPENTLVVGHSNIIESIQEKNYVAVVEYRHPGGGLYWTEFTKHEAS
jgi:hypothetical protein